TEPRLTRVYHLALSLGRRLPPWSRGMRRSLRNATRIGPDNTDKPGRAHQGVAATGRPIKLRLRPETVPHQSARSEHHSSRIVERSRNRPNNRACMPKRGRLPPLAQNYSGPAPASKLASQSALL